MKIFVKYACAALFFLFTSCGNNKEYWHALPQQSAAIASIDFPHLADRAGLNGKNGEYGLQRLKDMVKSGLEGSGQLVDRVFKDATESGIDFNNKLYVFLGEDNAYLGCLAKVSSSSKLENVINSFTKEQICQPIRETDGCNWTVLGKWLLAYSDDALLLLADNKWSDPSKLVRQASMWLRQEESQSFASNTDFPQLQNTQSDITLWTSLQLLPRKVISPLTMGVSAELDLKKIKAITTVNFEAGKTVVDVTPLVTDHIVRQLSDKKMQSMSQIKGNHLDLFPAKTAFWTTANIKGQKFYQFLREIPSIQKFFDYSDLPITLDYSRLFDAIDGDVSFAITDPRHKEFIFYADVKQTEFLNFFTDLRPMIEKTNGMLLLEERGKDAFCFATRNGSVMNLRPGIKIFWFGVKDGRFYFTNNEKLIDQHVLGLSLRNKEWGKHVPGMNYFAVTDWTSLRAFEYLLQKDFLKGVPDIVPSYINDILIESADGQQLRCTIEHKDKKQNLIQLLFQL